MTPSRLSTKIFLLKSMTSLLYYTFARKTLSVLLITIIIFPWKHLTQQNIRITKYICLHDNHNFRFMENNSKLQKLYSNLHPPAIPLQNISRQDNFPCCNVEKISSSLSCCIFNRWKKNIILCFGKWSQVKNRKFYKT